MLKGILETVKIIVIRNKKNNEYANMEFRYSLVIDIAIELIFQRLHPAYTPKQEIMIVKIRSIIRIVSLRGIQFT